MSFSSSYLFLTTDCPTPLYNRYFTYLIDGQIETLLEFGSSARLYRVYMDGSKQKHGIGAEVYIAETETKIGFKLSFTYSIPRTVKWLRYHKILGKDIVIITDSRSALKSLMSHSTKYRCVEVGYALVIKLSTNLNGRVPTLTQSTHIIPVGFP